ncbi:MAG: flagellar motor protein MotA [Gammaproteobacteria bacterium]|nr:flagellar motor protein MotA [Gammaproteobacteria bacterium]
MFIFLAIVGGGSYVLYEPLRDAFLANQVFNGMILGVLVIGIVVNLKQVLSLRPSSIWIDAYKTPGRSGPPDHPPRLLSSMAKLLSGMHRREFKLSAMTMRSLLDGVRLRLDESRDLSHYMIGLLVFLGLLGTFWGLLETIGSVGGVISQLSAGSGDLSATFEELKTNLQAPLAGMGTAFSSSLFGLAGSLIVGFIDLQTGHAQNRFYNTLEEWLSELAHLPSSGLLVEGEQSLPYYIEALLEQTADNLNNLQRTMVRGEEDRRTGQTRLMDLTEKLAELTDQMRAEQRLLVELAKNQMEMQPVIARLAEGATRGRTADEQMRDHLRNLDLTAARLADELVAGRGEMLDELRSEMRLLARVLSHSKT